MQKLSPKDLANYFTFWTEFFYNPRKALKPYSGKARINGTLIWFVIVAVVISWIISLIAGAIGTVEDTSSSLAFIHSFSTPLLPLVTVILLFIIGLAFHIFMAIWIYLYQFIMKSRSAQPIEAVPFLGGTVKDTLNGTFGFAAFFIPIVTFAISTVLILENSVEGPTLYVAMGLSIILGILSLYYFVSALASAHPKTSFWEAFFALSAGITTIAIVLELLGKIFQLK